MKASRSCRFQASCWRRRTCPTEEVTPGLEFWAVTLNEEESRINTAAKTTQFLRNGDPPSRNQCRIVPQQPTENATGEALETTGMGWDETPVQSETRSGGLGPAFFC